MANYRAIFQAEETALQALKNVWPDLTVETCDDPDTFWLGGPPLDLARYFEDFSRGLAAFTERVNCLIALIDPNLSGIVSMGSVEVITGDDIHRICLVDAGRIEYMGSPITLFAHGATRPVRPMEERALEFLEREPRFSRATNILAACGEDMRELFKVVELLERAHGGLPKKQNREERASFFARIEVLEDDWVALHRSFRPERHAEPHDMDGRTISPRLARYLVQHAVKLWLIREIPS